MLFCKICFSDNLFLLLYECPPFRNLRLVTPGPRPTSCSIVSLMKMNTIKYCTTEENQCLLTN